jgi:hypothetical protein
MKKAMVVLAIVFLTSMAVQAQTGEQKGQTGQGMMMGEGQQMPMMQMCMPMMKQMMADKKDMMQMMMDMMTMQEKMLQGPKAAEKKQIIKDMAQMKEKMQKMMSMPMDMKCMDASKPKGDAGSGPKNGEPAKTDPHKH